MSYFKKQYSERRNLWILTSIIVTLMIINVLMFKSLLQVAENKVISIKVPQSLEAGSYMIGADHSSDNVYKMWSRVWINDITNFSYNDITNKLSSIYPFLDPETAHKSKLKLTNFASFVKDNFITQSFEPEDFLIEHLQNGLVRVSVSGVVYRKIGNQIDEISGSHIVYELTMYTKNGSVFIKKIDSFFKDLAGDADILKKSKAIDFFSPGKELQEAIKKSKNRKKRKEEYREKMSK